MNQWTLAYESFAPQQERLREALCTLGNGYFATRGAAEEAVADPIHYPGTYLAGGYDRAKTEIAGRVVVNEDLVNLPNWLWLNFRPEDGEWFNLMAVEVLDYRQELNLREALLVRTVRLRDKRGRESTLKSRRLVHMGNPHLAAIELSLTPENWSGRIRVRSALDGSVVNAGVERYRELNSKHLETLEMGEAGESGIYLLVQTRQSRLMVAEAARTELFDDGGPLPIRPEILREEEAIAQEFIADVGKEKTLVIEKVAALHSSRDRAISESSLAAREAIQRARRFEELLESHARSWRHLWRRCDVELRSRAYEQMVLRLHIFHLLQTVSGNSVGRDLGVPARGLHGEAYRGHIFWDELFVFPFYNLRIPEITRTLLLYRYHRLGAARAAAKEAGFGGAMYPWQSGSDGSEETQRLHLNPLSGRWMEDHSYLQRHVNAAIVYNIWQYFKVTGDQEYMSYYGAETVLEIARFWASIARYSEETQRFGIEGVMGPDEYHDKYPDAAKGGLNNNAYTNVMAVWVLGRAAEALASLPEERRGELIEKLGLQEEELGRWEEITRRMTVPFHGEGIISQFEGYDRLREFDWDRYAKKYGNIERLDRILEAEGDSPNHYQVSKQADVLMLFYLLPAAELRRLFGQLGYPLDDEAIRRNLDYYIARTSHGSTLSRVVHAAVLARFDRRGSWSYFSEALKSDIADIQGGTTQEGIHLGAMAGIDDIVLSCYVGVDAWGETIAFNPCLPDELPGLHLRLRYRSRWLELELSKERLHLSLDRDGGEPLPVLIEGEPYSIAPGGSCDARL